MDRPRARKPRIPMTLVVGRLGAGKTSLINRLLDHPGFARTAVILNENGRTALRDVPAEMADDGVIALGSGCVCCTVRGELVFALERLLRGLDNGRLSAIDRVVIEADQDADPSAVMGAVLRHPYLSLRFRPDGIIAVVGNHDVEGFLTGDAVAATQVAIADMVVVPAGAADAEITTQLRPLNPQAVIVHSDAIRPDSVRGLGFWAWDQRTFDVAPFGLAETAESGGLEGQSGPINAFCLRRTGHLAAAAVDAFTDHLAGRYGSALVKVAGIIRGRRTVALVRGLGGTFLPGIVRDRPPGDGSRGTEIAVTGRHLSPADFADQLDGFLGTAGIDRPDRAALVDNPLSIAGFSARPGR